ncbi:MAG: hypothetical protein ABSG15_15665 [FCB group bacterium]
MGLLEPNSIIYVYCLDNKNDTIGIANDTIKIITKPAWLQKGYVDNITINNNVISMIAYLPIDAIFEDKIPNSMKVINNRTFSIFNNKIQFDINYDYVNRISLLTNPILNFTLNLLEQNYYTFNYSLGTENLLNLDENFDLYIKAEKESSIFQLTLQMPSLSFPVMEGITVKIDAGLYINLLISGKIIVGTQNNQWGFIKLDSESTGITTKLYGLGYIQGTIDVLYGILEASGTLYVDGLIGGGFDYISVPSTTLTPLFGGELGITGTIIITSFWGLGPDWTCSKEFYRDSFGNLPFIICNNKEQNKIQSETKKIVSSNNIPSV